MKQRKRYTDHPEDYQRVGLSQIAAEIGRTRRQTKRLLDSLAFIGATPRIGDKELTYPASAVEVVKALIDVPHRQLPGEVSWLDTYLGETNHEQLRRPGPRDAGPA